MQHKNIKNFEYEVDTKNISTRYKNFLTLFLSIYCKTIRRTKTPLSSEQIAIEYKLPIRLVNQILSELVDVRVMIEVFCENSKSKTYQPAIDINQLTVDGLFDRLNSHGSELFLTNKNELLDSFWHKTLEMKKLSEMNSIPVLVKDIL
jgi:membrane protein